MTEDFFKNVLLASLDVPVKRRRTKTLVQREVKILLDPEIEKKIVSLDDKIGRLEYLLNTKPLLEIDRLEAEIDTLKDVTYSIQKKHTSLVKKKKKATQTKKILQIEERLEEKIDKLEEVTLGSTTTSKKISETTIINLEQQIGRIELLLEQHKDKDGLKFQRLRKKMKRLKKLVANHKKKLSKSISKKSKKPRAPKKILVGSKTGKSVHTPSCIALERVNAKNRVVYKTKEAAVKAGLRPCRVCVPFK